MAVNDDGFLGRWSRRKALARQGQSAPDEPERAPAAHATVTRSTATVPEKFASNQPPGGDSRALAAPETEAKPLTLDDVKALTLDADFKPFVARSVAPEVRNAAFRKLFSDPHFNVMDGLDIYIDDYSKPEPMPTSVLKQLASARFLKLVEEEETPPPSAPPSGAAPAGEARADDLAPLSPADAHAQLEPSHETCQPGAAPDTPDAATISHAQDPDLRLQPDDAARHAADRTKPE
jgi:hypothetical protein